ncbi:MAG: M23 family metallopeptidase [Acidobacteriota bacterium]
MSRHREKRRIPPVLLLGLIASIAAAGYFGLRRGPAPAVAFAPSLPAVGPSTSITITLTEPSRGLSSFRVLADPGGIELLAEEHAPRAGWALWRPVTSERAVTVQLGTEHQPDLQEGTVELTVETEAAGTWLLPPKALRETSTLPVKLQPPALQLVSDRPVVRQGGSGAVVYSIGERAVRHGVRVGELEVLGHPLPRADGDPDGSAHFVLYGVPHDLTDSGDIVLFAADELGNRAERQFLSRFDARRFTADEIRLSEDFLRSVVPAILDNSPEVSPSGDLLQDYLEVNRNLRRLGAERLREMSARSTPERLWRGAFDQLPSSRVMAVFGDRRTYLFNGQAIDQQTHLGHDLASVRRAPVPAAESGRVMLAEYFGIYGNTVVIDHGYGLLTLYSHLSSMSVASGDSLTRGAELGRTGVSGMAGGDHLHFSVVVGGVMVEPLEWWDRRWLESRLAGPLGEAFAIAGSGG